MKAPLMSVKACCSRVTLSPSAGVSFVHSFPIFRDMGRFLFEGKPRETLRLPDLTGFRQARRLAPYLHETRHKDKEPGCERRTGW
jgi:hypothetical protein